MAAKSPLQRFYEQQLALVGSEPKRSGASGLELTTIRPSTVYSSGGAQSSLPEGVAEQVARADAALKKADKLGVAKKAQSTLLTLGAGLLSAPGELVRGTGFGLWNTIADNVLNDKSLTIDLSGDGRVDGKDSVFGQIKAAINPYEDVNSFSAMEPFKFREGDNLLTKTAKFVGAVGADIAADPTTPITGGTGTLGRTKAAELVGKQFIGVAADDGAKIVASSLAKDVLEKSGDDVIERLAKTAISKSDDAIARSAGGKLDDAVKAIYDGLSPEDRIARAAETLGTEAQAAYRRDSNIGLRRTLNSVLGKDIGEEAFAKMPAPVRGGIRYAGRDIAGNKAGGGRILEKLGAPGEKLADVVVGTNRVRNRLGSLMSFGGEAGKLTQAAKGAAVAAAKTGDAAEQAVLERAVINQGLAKQAENAVRNTVARRTTEAAQVVDSMFKTHGREKFNTRVLDFYDAVNIDAAEAAARAKGPLSQFDEDAIRVARMIRDVHEGTYAELKDSIGDNFSALEAVTGSRRVLSEASQIRLAQTAEQIATQSKNPSSILKSRTQYWNEAEGRWMTIREANQAAGREEFDTDIRKILIVPSKKMEDAAIAGIRRNMALEAGLIINNPKDMQVTGAKLEKIGKKIQKSTSAKADAVRARAAAASEIGMTDAERALLSTGDRATTGDLTSLMDEVSQLPGAQEVLNKRAARQRLADAESQRILDEAAPIFAEERRLNLLMQRIAEKPLEQQDDLYKQLAEFITTRNTEIIGALEARAAKVAAEVGTESEEFAKALASTKRMRDWNENFKNLTDPDASVLNQMLRDKNYVRVGTRPDSAKIEKVTVDFRNFFTPTALADSMIAMHKLGAEESANKLISHVYEPFEKLWRTYATVGRGPGFVVRNVLGGTGNALIAGTGPKGFEAGSRYTQAIFQTEKRVKSALKNGTIPPMEVGRFVESILKDELSKLPAVGGRSMWDLHNEMANRGMFNGLTVAALGEDAVGAKAVLGKNKRDVIPFVDRAALQSEGVGKRAAVSTVDFLANNPWVSLISSWSSTSETFLRSSVFLGAVAKNGGDIGSLAYAEMLVKATQFDYGDLSRTERKVVKFIAPFYVWTKNNIPLQLRSLVNRPGIPSAIFKAQDVAEENLGGEGEWATTAERFMPDYVSRAMGFAGKGDNPLYFGIGAPLADLGRIQTGIENVDSIGDVAKLPLTIAGGLGEESVAQLNPLLKMGVESATGNSLFTGAEYGKEPVTGLLAPLVPGGTIDPETGQREASAFAMAQARNLFPMLGLLQRGVKSTANPILGNPNYDDRIVTSWLSSIAGLGGLPFAAPMGTATDSQISGQASRQAKENNKRFEEAVAAKGLDPERYAALIARNASQEEIDQLIAEGWLLAPYKRAELGLP